MLDFCCRAGFSLIAVSRGHSSLHCEGFLLQWPPFAEHRLEGSQTSVVAACGFNGCSSWALEHRPNSCGTRAEFCSATYGIFPVQVSNLCLLHWQVNSLPLSHQGRPGFFFFFLAIFFFGRLSKFLGSQFPGQVLNSGHISETQNPNH